MKMLAALIAMVAFAACAPVDAPAQENDAMITMSRTACYGTCPIYSVSISGDGEVVYNGRGFVHAVGERRAQIPAADVSALLRRFDEIGFMQLQDEYRARITDHPSTIVTLTRGGQSKRVVDYAGTRAGMPEAVRELQAEIDRVARTDQWVLRDGQPVRTPPQP